MKSMDYYLRLGCWGGVFAVPNQVVDDYIKLASGASLKVLLYMLRNNTQPQSQETIAAKLNLSREAVEDGFAFWEQLGILSQAPLPPAESVSAPEPSPAQQIPQAPLKKPAEAVNAKPAEKPESIAHNRDFHRSERLNPSEIAGRVAQSDMLRFLFESCERTMKKPLNGTEQNMLIWLTDYLGLPPEAVIMLVEYCASIGKASSHYIEKVALSWADRGIATLTDIDNEIRLLNEQHTYTNRIMSILGMSRKPTTKEKDFIEQWLSAGHSPELVFHAYEKAVDNTGKVSFSYMAKVLDGWKQLGITTREEAEQSGKKRAKAANNAATHSYDLNELDSLAVNLAKK